MLTLIEVELSLQTLLKQGEDAWLTAADAIIQTASNSDMLESGTRKKRLKRWKKRVFDEALKKQPGKDQEKLQQALSEIKESVEQYKTEIEWTQNRHFVELVALVGGFILHQTGIAHHPIHELVALVLLLAEIGDWVNKHTG